VNDGNSPACPSDTILGLSKPAAIGLSAGILATIIIVPTAAIIACIVGSKKGYDYYKKRAENMNAANSNPLYNDEGRTGQNPFHE